MKKKRSKVERLAEKMATCMRAGADEFGQPVAVVDWDALARWHLREVERKVSRAKGKTVGYVRLRRESDESGEDCWYEIKGPMLDGPINVRMSQMIYDEVARVVLVPRRKGGAR